MIVQIYRHAKPGRTMMHAVFAKESSWGAERAGHVEASWAFVREFELGEPRHDFPYTQDEVVAALGADGIFVFEVQHRATELEEEENRILTQYRLRATIPLLRDAGPVPEILGTGTLITHEGRYFIVTADHIFRDDLNDSSSALIAMEDVAVPTRPVEAALHTLGRHTVYRVPPPVLADVIVLELLEPATISMLKSGWGFFTPDQSGELQANDRFVISGFMIDRATFTDNTVRQAMLNLETDLLFDTPEVKEPAPDYDVFFYLQADGAALDGGRRPLRTLRGLSGGPIWALRRPAPGEFWAPSKMLTMVAVQSSEMRQEWARGVRWSAVLRILRSSAVGFVSPP